MYQSREDLKLNFCVATNQSLIRINVVREKITIVVRVRELTMFDETSWIVDVCVSWSQPMIHATDNWAWSDFFFISRGTRLFMYTSYDHPTSQKILAPSELEMPYQNLTWSCLVCSLKTFNAYCLILAEPPLNTLCSSRFWTKFSPNCKTLSPQWLPVMMFFHAFSEHYLDSEKRTRNWAFLFLIDT